MAGASVAHLALPTASFDGPSPIPWPSTYNLLSTGDYPFGPPQDESIEAYVERRYLECLWMPEILEPLSALVPSLQRVTPPDEWSPTLAPHPLHAVLDEHLLDLVDIHKKYRKTIPGLLEKESDAQDAEEACVWYAWTHAQPDDAVKATEGQVHEDKWAKQWLHEAEKREYLVQILLRMLKLTLPPPPAPKRKRRKNKDADDDKPVYADVVTGLEMLVDRIGIIRQTATSTLNKEKDEAAGKENDVAHDWAAMFCQDVLKPLFEESLPEHYETVRYHCIPVPSRPTSPARSEASVVEIPKPQASKQPLARSTSVSTRAGSLHARSNSHARSLSREDSLARSISGPIRHSRSRSGSVEPPLDVDARSKSRSRSVSFAARSAGGIRAPLQRPGTRPVQGPRGKSKMRQVNSAPGVGLGRPARATAPEPAPRAQTTVPTTLVAATPQKPSRTMNREISTASISFSQRLQASQSQSQTQRRVSMEDSGLGEFMVASPERSRDDFMLGDMVLETPTKPKS